MRNNREFKPLTPERRFGIVLLALTLVGFFIAALTERSGGFWFYFGGTLGALCLFSGVFLAAKSVDDNGGFDEKPYDFGDPDDKKDDDKGDKP